MAETIKTVAFLTDNPALSAILSDVLASRPGLRVRCFDSLDTLRKYISITGIDLLVCDYATEEATADQFIPELRAVPGNETPMFKAIALTRQVPPQMRRICATAGIDEIIVKPMSPRYVEERVVARLSRAEPGVPAQRETDLETPQIHPERYGDNIVPLFPRDPSSIN